MLNPIHGLFEMLNYVYWCISKVICITRFYRNICFRRHTQIFQNNFKFTNCWWQNESCKQTKLKTDNSLEKHANFNGIHWPLHEVDIWLKYYKTGLVDLTVEALHQALQNCYLTPLTWWIETGDVSTCLSTTIGK